MTVSSYPNALRLLPHRIGWDAGLNFLQRDLGSPGRLPLIGMLDSGRFRSVVGVGGGISHAESFSTTLSPVTRHISIPGHLPTIYNTSDCPPIPILATQRQPGSAVIYGSG